MGCNVQAALSAILLLSSGLDYSAVAAESVPAQFIGTWSPNLEDCASGNNDGIVIIEGSYISHWESAGPIRAVVVRNHDEMALVAELAGEGDTRLSTERYVLTPKSGLMFASNFPGRELALFRCPPPL